MENWLGIFTLIVVAMVVNLVVAFVVLRGLAKAMGVPASHDTSREALLTLVTIVPVAGVAGAPFIIMPLIGPPLAFFVSGCVAPMMLASRYEISNAQAAKIILPTVAAIYVVSAIVLYIGIPMVL